LGAGNFAKVFLASSTNNPDLKVAIKAIHKNKLTKDALDIIKQEI